MDTRHPQPPPEDPISYGPHRETPVGTWIVLVAVALLLIGSIGFAGFCLPDAACRADPWPPAQHMLRQAWGIAVTSITNLPGAIYGTPRAPEKSPRKDDPKKGVVK